jgi:hypothetical protein
VVINRDVPKYIQSALVFLTFEGKQSMQVLGQEVAFKDNLVFSLRRYLVWWLILMVTMIFDYLSTLYFVEKYGSHLEANHVVRILIERFGANIGTLMGKLLQLMAVVFFVSLHRRLGNLFLLVVILLNCWAVVINTLR